MLIIIQKQKGLDYRNCRRFAKRLVEWYTDNMNIFTTCIIAAIIFSAAPRVSAMEPPRAGEIEKMAQEGTLQKHLDFANRLGNNKFSDELVAKYKYSMAKMRQQLSGDKNETYLTPPREWQNMPTTGNVRIVVIPIKFPDVQNKFTQAQIQSSFFGSGTDTLASFYGRSSFGQLTINGTVLPWYTYTDTRVHITSAVASSDDEGAKIRENIIKSAMNYHASNGVDFSVYDNTRGGYINYFLIVWSGTPGGWSSFWWAYKTTWYQNTDYTISGKKLKNYVWQWEAFDPLTATTPDAETAKHETGHALGLPDYYDYDVTIGPQGGGGGWDRMDSKSDNKTDHNAFSKFVLGWLTPSVYTSANQTLNLGVVSTSSQAIQMMPTAVSSTSLDEYYLAEYRSTGYYDDSEMPTSGVYIWHVDARLDANKNNYYYENSYSPHKLLKLMEADGENYNNTGYSYIESSTSNFATADSVFTAGGLFTPVSSPASKNYQGYPTGIGIGPLGAAAGSYSVPLKIASNTAQVTDLSASSGTTQGDVKLAWTVPAGVSSYEIKYATGTVEQTYNFNEVTGDSWSFSSSNGTAGNWSRVVGAGPDGSPALVSGALTRGTNYYGYSIARRTVYGPATVSFKWRVNSDEESNFLNFIIDGTPVKRITGAPSWAASSHSVTGNGFHTVSWEFTQISSGTGSDKGYIDDVVITPLGDPVIDWAAAVSATNPAPAQAGSVQNFTISNLDPAYSYYFNMRTVDARTMPSLLSATVKQAPANSAPTKPTRLKAAAERDGLTLSWAASSSDTAFYRIYEDSSTAVKWDDPFIAATTTEVSYKFTSLPLGVTVYFRVSAVDAGAPPLESAYSDDVYFVSVSTDVTVTASDGTSVYLPQGSFPTALSVSISSPVSTRADVAAANSALDPLGGLAVIADVNFNREFFAVDIYGAGVSSFTAPIQISIAYPDTNSDGLVDGTNIQASNLALYYLDPSGPSWEEVPGYSVNTSLKVVQAWVSHFSVFSLLNSSAQSVNFGSLVVYPQPCYMKTTGKVTFGRMPYISDLTIYIYTLAGELVRTLNKDSGIYSQGLNLKGEWDGHNSNGEQVASGMYFYLIKAGGSVEKGQLGIFW